MSARAGRGWAGGLFTALVLVFLLVPLGIVALFSLHSSPSLTFPFQGFSTRWYDEVFGNEQFREALFNSLELALATAAFTFVFGTAAAYGVTRSGSRLAGAGVALFLLPITLPLLFVGIALLIALRRVDIELSLLTILIGHSIIAFPFFFMIARVALDRLDPMLEEAAADLGASPWTAFRKVTLPQVFPVLLGAAALAFMVSLDEFVVTFFVSRQRDDPAAVHLLAAADDPEPEHQRRLDPVDGDHPGALHLRLRDGDPRRAPPRAPRRRSTGPGGMSDAALRFERVGHSYQEGEPVLREIDLEVADGEFVTLLGPSGCGKTTLLRIAAGFLRPSEGAVYLRGEDVTAVPPHRRAVNLVFQRAALFPHLDVYDNLAFGLKLAKLPKREVAGRVREALELVRLEGYAHRRSGELSGGQAQRVALARALINRPQVLLMDEPLSALDLRVRLEMEAELRRLHRETATTFVYVTHDQHEALALSDRIAVLDRGEIAQLGTPAEIYHRPASALTARFVGDANVLPGEGGELTVLRQEDVVLREAGAGAADAGAANGAAGALHGTVRDVGFRGAGYSYLVECPQLPEPLKAEVPSDAGAAARDRHRGDGQLGPGAGAHLARRLMRRFLVLAGVVFVVEASLFSSLAALLPHYEEELGISSVAAGLLSGSYAAGMILGTVIAGLWVSDRLGVRATAVSGGLLLAAATVVFGLGEGIELLDAARFTQGIGAGLLWVAMLNWLIQISPSEARGESIGAAIGAAVLGTAVGPLLGGATGLVGELPVFAAVACLVLVLTLTLAIMPGLPTAGAERESGAGPPRT